MRRLWKKIQDNARGLGVVLTVIALLVSVFSVPKLIEVLFPSIPDIVLSQMSEPQVAHLTRITSRIVRNGEYQKWCPVRSGLPLA